MSNNKVTTYLLYAIGEIVLVVVGILIAVQIDDWNEQNKLHEEEQKILNNLSKEVSYNIQVFDSIQLTHVQQIASINTLRDSTLSNYSLNNLDSLYLSAFNFFTYDPSQGVINSLLYSGKIDILTNDELKYRVSRLSNIIIDYQDDEVVIKDYILDHVFPELSNLIDADYNYYFTNKKREKQQLKKDSIDYLKAFRNRKIRNQLNHLNGLLFGGPINEGPGLRKELVTINNLVKSQINKKE